MTLAFLALLGAPYIYDISSLRVNTYGVAEVQQHTFHTSSLRYLEVLASLFGLFALRNIPRYALNRWMCGLQTRAGPLALAGNRTPFFWLSRLTKQRFHISLHIVPEFECRPESFQRFLSFLFYTKLNCESHDLWRSLRGCDSCTG